MKYPCPCCGYLTRSESAFDTYDICAVCNWEDDGLQFDEPDFEGGANEVSLRTARANYAAFGASDRQFLDRVRKPLPDEIPTEIDPKSGQT